MTTPAPSSTVWTAIRNAIVNTNLIDRKSVVRPPSPDGVQLPFVELSDMTSMSVQLKGDGNALYWYQEAKAILRQQAKAGVTNFQLPKLLGVALAKQHLVINGESCFMRLVNIEFTDTQTVTGAVEHTIVLGVWSPLTGV